MIKIVILGDLHWNIYSEKIGLHIMREEINPFALKMKSKKIFVHSVILSAERLGSHRNLNEHSAFNF